MSYSLSYKMSTGAGCHSVLQADEVLDAHIRLGLAGATEITVRCPNDIILSLSKIASIVREDRFMASLRT